MSNRVCPQCGEEYSTTYKSCPFCEEEEAIRRGTPIRRRGGKRVDTQQRKSGGAGGVMLLLTGVIILGVAAFLFLGDRVADTMGIRKDPDPASSQDGEQGSPTDPGSPDGEEDPVGENRPVHTEDPPAQEDPAVSDSSADPPEPPGPLELSQSVIQIASGDTARLTDSGGTGDISWSSSNEHIATVDGGAVTGVAGGTVTITAASGEETASCTVTVTGDPYVSDLKLKLNKTDFSLPSTDPDVQMRVFYSGTNQEYDGVVIWASNDPTKAAISETGLVTWVGRGTTTITATVEGQVLECIVRCGR